MAANLTGNPLVFDAASQGEGTGTSRLPRGTFTAATSDIVTMAGHGFTTGNGPFQLTTSNTLPAGLSLATDYYAIRIDANTFYMATTYANAMAETRVDVTDTGTGTHTLSMLPLFNHRLFVKTIVIDAGATGGTFEVSDASGGRSLTGALSIAANSHEQIVVDEFVEGVYMTSLADGQVLVYLG